MPDAKTEGALPFCVSHLAFGIRHLTSRVSSDHDRARRGRDQLVVVALVLQTVIRGRTARPVASAGRRVPRAPPASRAGLRLSRPDQASAPRDHRPALTPEWR